MRAATRDPERLARTAVDGVRELLGCDGAMVSWWDETQRVLVPLARIDPRRPGPDPVLHPQQGLVGEVFRTGRARAVGSYREDVASAPAWTRIAALLAVPLVSNGRPHGVLAGFHYRPREWDAEALAAAERLAARVAGGLTSVRLLVAAQRRTAEAQALADLARSAAAADDPEAAVALVSEYAALLLGADVAGLVLRGAIDRPTGWRGVYGNRTAAWQGRCELFGGATRLVGGDADPFLAAEQVRSALVLPLRGRAVGSLVLGWRFALEPAPAHIELGERFADFATAIVDRAETAHERELLIAHAPVILAAIDADGVVTACAGAAAERIGVGPDVVGRRYQEALADAPALVARIQTAPADRPTELTANVRGRDFDVRMVPRAGGGGYMVATDVTERVRLTREIEHQATHDALTGLPNRASVVSAAEAALAHAPLVAVIADIRAFDAVNETAGHDAGDELLRILGRRLAGEMRDAVVVGRTGGDEFSVVLPWGDPRRVADTVRASLAGPVEVGERRLAVDARCGVAVARAGESARALLRAADSALQSARRDAGMVIVHDSAMAEDHRRQLELSADLRHALAHGAIDAWFQPIVDLETGAPVRLEALARWRHARHGWVAPPVFVDLAERSGLIGALTEQMLEHALRAAKALSLPVSLNISGVDLAGSSLPTTIAAALARHGVAPGLLSLEITESFRLEREAGALDALERMRALGLMIAIDDFGTGWSSFTLLERLPASVLKLDRTYVGRAAVDPASLAIVRSTIALADALGLHVIAEGIEDEPTRLALCQLGCRRGQGNHFAAPMPFAALRGTLIAP